MKELSYFLPQAKQTAGVEQAGMWGNNIISTGFREGKSPRMGKGF
jgi:hypothetical protein